jgi:hypothetical protein
VKEIGGLLVGVPYSGGILHMDLGIHMVVGAWGFPWAGQAGREPAVRLPKTGFEQLGEGSSGMGLGFDFVLGKGSCWNHRAAG